MRKTGEEKKCLVCKKPFYAPGWLLKKSGGKYCSHKCYSKSKIGNEPWNKGSKGLTKRNSGSFYSSESKWKGTLKEYKILHYWVGKYLGKPKGCSMCKTVINTRGIHWANISGEYKKELSDWIRLCAKCHYEFDNVERRRGI